jgi:hypothetical protein
MNTILRHPKACHAPSTQRTWCQSWSKCDFAEWAVLQIVLRSVQPVQFFRAEWGSNQQFCHGATTLGMVTRALVMSVGGKLVLCQSVSTSAGPAHRCCRFDCSGKYAWWHAATTAYTTGSCGSVHYMAACALGIHSERCVRKAPDHYQHGCNHCSLHSCASTPWPPSMPSPSNVGSKANY